MARPEFFRHGVLLGEQFIPRVGGTGLRLDGLGLSVEVGLNLSRQDGEGSWKGWWVDRSVGRVCQGQAQEEARS